MGDTFGGLVLRFDLYSSLVAVGRVVELHDGGIDVAQREVKDGLLWKET